ncbi:hypothetical protein ARMGADRAFT_1071032 [Armillaria gallica]|uniref:Uncharacterized protein n=1 Tax=Armillaria gallica TaxID=47427 RepID=A0A2H3EZ90_ARMGA|nr:hypothetical protein ARMGADRAFT_1071032 [Armillaria gallica]
MRPRLDLTVEIELYRHLVLKCTNHKCRDISPSSIRRFKDGLKSTDLSACKTHWRISRSFIIECRTTFSYKNISATIVDVTLRSMQLQARGYFWLMIGSLQPGVWKALFIRLHLVIGVQNSGDIDNSALPECQLVKYHRL